MLVLAALALGALWGARTLDAKVRDVLAARAPGLAFESLEIGLRGLHLDAVSFRSKSGGTSYTATRIAVRPRWSSLFAQTVTVASVDIDGFHIERDGSRPRTREGDDDPDAEAAAAGEKKTADTASRDNERGGGDDEGGRSVVVERFSANDGTGSIVEVPSSGAPVSFEVSDIAVVARDLRFPPRAQRVPLQLSFSIEGATPARVSNKGWVDPVSRSAHLELSADRLSLVQIQPYYQDHREASRLTGGTLSLQATLDVDGDAFSILGKIRADGLEFDRSEDAFFGVPMHLVDEYLREHEGELGFPFKVSARVDAKKRYREAFLAGLMEALTSVLNVEDAARIRQLLEEGDLEGSRRGLREL